MLECQTDNAFQPDSQPRSLNLEHAGLDPVADFLDPCLDFVALLEIWPYRRVEGGGEQGLCVDFQQV